LWAWKRIPFIAMPNIILQRRIIPELLGLHCRPETIAREIGKLLNDAGARQAMEEGYQEIRRHLGSDLPLGATEQTARIIEEMVGLTSPASPSVSVS
jgi:lipid-A-disaccharide synthase